MKSGQAKSNSAPAIARPNSPTPEAMSIVDFEAPAPCCDKVNSAAVFDLFSSSPFTMAAPARYCPSCLSLTSSTTLLRRTAAAQATTPFLTHQVRNAGQTSANAQKYKRKDQPASQKKKKQRSTFAEPDLKNAIQFSLVDAMR